MIYIAMAEPCMRTARLAEIARGNVGWNWWTMQKA
jgi:hypothetical protein